MPSVEDAEFGTVTVRRSTKARYVRIRVAPNGTLRASLPKYAPLYMVKRLLKESREEIRTLLKDHHAMQVFESGMQIGKSHSLIVANVRTENTTIRREGLKIIVTLAKSADITDMAVQGSIREAVIEALRKEARAHLTKRLKYLADTFGYSYERVRFSHASGRWGSCSSNGTISLNIALMKLPFELIDYVLVHELSHTVEMNHSDRFWQHVAAADPAYLQHRKALQAETPAI